MNINKTIFNCAYCNKNYVRKSAYNVHLTKCKISRFASVNNCANNQCFSDFDSLKKDITINNLFSMVIMLYNKYEKMEAEYNELKKYATITKNKINILDHLNENCKQEYLNVGLNFKKFIDGLVIDQNMLDKIFKYDYVDGILNIFIEYIKLCLLIPIKCFNVKENVLYIFDDDKWIIMDDDYLRIFIKSFDKKMLLQFLQWKIDSEKKFDSETFGEIYIINMKKVIAGNFEKKNKVVMIRNRIYKYLKVDF